MKNYQNRSYTVQAKNMTWGEYVKYRCWETAQHTRNLPDDYGYLVINPNISERNVDGVDGYVSWLPEKAFHEVYYLADFGDTWQGRLRLEYQQLQERTEKLYAFLQTNPKHQAAEILRHQYFPMHQYLYYLRERVAALGEPVQDLPGTDVHEFKIGQRVRLNDRSHRKELVGRETVVRQIRFDDGGTCYQCQIDDLVFWPEDYQLDAIPDNTAD